MTPAFDPQALPRIPSETFVEQVWYRREVASTSDVALGLAAEQDALPLLVLTSRQTAGRGRGANRWWSAEGSLTFSLILDWPLPERTASGQVRDGQVRDGQGGGGGWTRISLAVGLAVSDLLEQLLPTGDIGLKWPNDVFLCGRKVCGILVETRPDARGRLVLGIGLNVNNRFDLAPPEVRSLGVSLRDVTGSPLSLLDVLIGLLRQLDRRLHELRHERLDLPREWARRCILTGHTVRVDSGNRQTLGLCGGIEADGALLLHTETGSQRCYSGIVRRQDA